MAIDFAYFTIMGINLYPRKTAVAILSGKALAEARDKKNWTQAQLSEATKPKVDVSTISRIERGKVSRVQENTLRALAKALDVPPESLCPTPEAEREVMKLRVESAARNALTLVARRYGIKRERIVEIAPLLFFIAAEQSLQQRRERIAALRDSGRALYDSYSGTPHLPKYWPVDEAVLRVEHDSIEARDLFSAKVSEAARQFQSEWDAEFDKAQHNPFVAFLQDGLSKFDNSSETVEPVRWGLGLSPEYKICADEAAKIVGNDKQAIGAILCGDAALHEMLNGTSEERATWAKAEVNRKHKIVLDAYDDSTDGPDIF